MQRNRVWSRFRISSSFILGARASPYSTVQTASARRPAAQRTADGPADMEYPEHLFHYTSGRWLCVPRSIFRLLLLIVMSRYNEQQRMKERERVFNVNELKRLAAEAVSRKVEDVVYFDKLGEGGANRAFVLHMKDGSRLVARIPYTGTAQRQLAVASEAATMSFLRSQGVPVPQIHGYSTSADNPAGTEYIIMEYSLGTNLSDSWFEMNEQDRSKFITSLVALEARLLNIRLPANGSIYFLRDLPANVDRVAIDDDSQGLDSFYIGPSTSPNLWRGRRGGLDVNRGPCEWESPQIDRTCLQQSSHRNGSCLDRWGQKRNRLFRTLRPPSTPVRSDSEGDISTRKATSFHPSRQSTEISHSGSIPRSSRSTQAPKAHPPPS